MYFTSDGFESSGKDRWSVDVGSWEVEIDKSDNKIHWNIYMHTPLCQRVLVDSSRRERNTCGSFGNAVHESREALDGILRRIRDEQPLMQANGWDTDVDSSTTRSGRRIKDE